MGGVIRITIISLFHFIRNKQHPEKWSVSIRTSSENVNASIVFSRQYPQIYEKIPLEKLYSLCFLSIYQQVCLGMYDLLVTTQHEWVNNFLGLIWKNITEKVGKLV